MPYRILLTLLLFLPLWLNAAGEAESDEVKPAPVPETLKSPRATMNSFLGAMNDIKRGNPDAIETAMSTLDLSEVNILVRDERGRDLSWMLLDVIDRTRLVNMNRIPNREEGDPWNFHVYESGVIAISRQEDGRWLFDKRTVALLPELRKEVADRKLVTGIKLETETPWHIRLQQSMPDWLQEERFVLPNWQWLGLFILVLLGVIVDRIVALLLRGILVLVQKRTDNETISSLPHDMLRPFGVMAMAAFWWVGLGFLLLPEQALVILLVAVKFLVGLAGIWAAYRLVDLVGSYFRSRALATENTFDDALVGLIPRTMKIFVTAIGIIFVAENLNLDVSGLLAGLGLGGLAFALAAKDMVQNFFGSVMVLFDRTFSVGDWIKAGDVEGTVEEIGFRSTRIRTFHNSLLTVPNLTFITAKVDNMGKRRYRRFTTKLSIAYDTPPDRIEAFCEAIRELVRQHPYMRKDYFQAYLNELGASSLDVLVYVFWETPDWSTELRERHRFLLDCLRVAQRLGIEYAYPTQTLYLKRPDAAEEGEERPQESAIAEGREAAKAVVEETTGLGARPDPVRFPPG